MLEKIKEIVDFSKNKKKKFENFEKKKNKIFKFLGYIFFFKKINKYNPYESFIFFLNIVIFLIFSIISFTSFMSGIDIPEFMFYIAKTSSIVLLIHIFILSNYIYSDIYFFKLIKNKKITKYIQKKIKKYFKNVIDINELTTSVLKKEYNNKEIINNKMEIISFVKKHTEINNIKIFQLLFKEILCEMYEDKKINIDVFTEEIYSFLNELEINNYEVFKDSYNLIESYEQEENNKKIEQREFLKYREKINEKVNQNNMSESLNKDLIKQCIKF